MKKKCTLFIIILLCFTQLESTNRINKFLIFGGKTGWIGQQLITLLQAQGYQALAAESRLENRTAIEKEIAEKRPDCIINAAGVTGTPNIDWCEDHKVETIRTNIIGALNLIDIASRQNVYVINMGTGCIYEYDAKHPMYSGIGFKEDEEPNFQGSFYSYTKTMFDKLLRNYPHVLNLRLRMPISYDLHPRNIITKLIHYKKVINIPNSMTVLPDLLPLIPDMAKRQLTGNYNFVNPGAISHNEILDLYKQYVNPEFSYSNFTIEEQDKILKARRSNTELDVSKLLSEFPDIPHIKESIVQVFKKMSAVATT